MACRKISYSSRRDAKRASEHNDQPQRERPALRPYLCEHCGFYHLTRASKRAIKLRRKRGDDSPL